MFVVVVHRRFFLSHSSLLCSENSRFLLLTRAEFSTRFFLEKRIQQLRKCGKIHLWNRGKPRRFSLSLSLSLFSSLSLCRCLHFSIQLERIDKWGDYKWIVSSHRIDNIQPVDSPAWRFLPGDFYLRISFLRKVRYCRYYLHSSIVILNGIISVRDDWDDFCSLFISLICSTDWNLSAIILETTANRNHYQNPWEIYNCRNNRKVAISYILSNTHLYYCYNSIILFYIISNNSIIFNAFYVYLW